MSLTTPTESHYPAVDLSVNQKKRAIAYSMDSLIPGLYIWLGNVVLQFGGETPDDQPYRYPGVINSSYGIAVVLPGYRIFTAYQQSYDPR
jgi:hypothetical protein